jgi:nucleotidyltransferase substrate binding protein (TIGR01987 family)
MDKVNYKFEQLRNAFGKLEEALSLDFPTPETKADSVIQRFEFTTELFWKFLKALLEHKGVIANATPVDVIRAAKTAGILAADDQWIALIRDRNITGHTYDEAQAIAIYDRVKNTYVAMFKQFIESYAKSNN